MLLTEIQTKIDKIKGVCEDLKNRIKENEIEKRINKRRQRKIEKCIELLIFISELNQEKITKLFEFTISAGLKDLFDDTYDFKFDMKTRGNVSACDFLLQCDSFPGWSDIVMANGKSVQDVISTIFRITLVKINKRSRKIVMLDEPLSGVESERQRLASKFLADISKKFGIQLLVVTHSKELIEFCDKEVRIDEKRS